MKRLYTFCLLAVALLMPWMASADSVNQEQALAKAVQFFSQSPQTRTTPSFELIWDGESAATRSTTEPAFYIFNRTDATGFVIIAGDDAVSPVIGYSFEHPFGKGEMPSNLRYWLETVRTSILTARAAGAPAVAQAVELGSTDKLLETADWDQDDPYNRECPVYGGKASLTGCVATAAAIVCQYNRWPDQGVGPTAAYVTRTRKISIGQREMKPYNYDLLPKTYTTGAYSEAEAAEVSRLMADLGAAIQADYARTDGTSAFSHQQLRAMVKNMRYNQAARLIRREGYTDEEWADLMRAEIDADRPVLYSALDSNAGGHAFVLDGYTSDGMFFFNWGWSGSSNGAYSLDVMNAGGYNFTEGHEAIVDLWPDKTGASTTTADLLAVYPQSGHPGFSASTKIFTQGSAFTTQLYFMNYTSWSYNGKVAVALVDQDYKIKELVSDEHSVSVNAAGNDGSIYLSSIRGAAKISASILPGDRLIPIYWDRATNGWVRMRSWEEAAVDEIIVMEPNPDGDAVASNTQFSYNRTTKEVSIQTYAGATFEVLDASGKKVASQTVGNEPIVLKNYAAGSYTVRIYFDESRPFEFKLTL